MLETAFSKRVIAYRRQKRKLEKQGYEYLGEGGGKIWELQRGWRTRHKITAVEIAADGKGVYVKVEPEHRG